MVNARSKEIGAQSSYGSEATKAGIIRGARYIPTRYIGLRLSQGLGSPFLGLVKVMLAAWVGSGRRLTHNVSPREGPYMYM